MRGVSAFVLAALAACSVSAQDVRGSQQSVSTQVEEIYVVRSVPEPGSAQTGFCAQERIGFGGATVDAQLTLRSTATQTSDGRIVDTNVKTVGTLHTCLGPTQNPDIRNFYAEGDLRSTSFRGVGECFGRKTNFPEQGLRAFNCFLDLSGLPSGYVGGQLTTNSMLSPKGQGPETDPPGYAHGSIVTIRLWRKRDAPSSAMPLTKESLVGTWKLVSMINMTDKGEVQHPWGEKPTGFLTYTADGRVSVVMISSEAKPLPSPTNPDFALLVPSAAYAGSYSFTGDKVTHHIEASSIQNIVNTDQVRSVTFQGDRLTLRVGPYTGRGGVPMAYTDYVWERMKSETAGK